MLQMCSNIYRVLIHLLTLASRRVIEAWIEYQSSSLCPEVALSRKMSLTETQTRQEEIHNVHKEMQKDYKEK